MKIIEHNGIRKDLHIHCLLSMNIALKLWMESTRIVFIECINGRMLSVHVLCLLENESAYFVQPFHFLEYFSILLHFSLFNATNMIQSLKQFRSYFRIENWQSDWIMFRVQTKINTKYVKMCSEKYFYWETLLHRILNKNLEWQDIGFLCNIIKSPLNIIW